MAANAAINTAKKKVVKRQDCKTASLYGKSNIATIKVNTYNPIKNSAPTSAKILLAFFIKSHLSFQFAYVSNNT